MRGTLARGLALLLILSSLAVAAPEAFTVQVASTSKRDEAERLVAVLAGRDIAAYWTEANVGGKTVYRVRVGSFPTRDKAKAFAEDLPQELGLSYWVAKDDSPPFQTSAPASPIPASKIEGTPTPLPVVKLTPPPPEATPTAIAKATPAPKKEDAAALLASAMKVHGGAAGGFAAIDKAASVSLSYRLKSLDAKTGAPVFTRHVYRRKGKDRLRLEISAIEDTTAIARDASGKPITAAASVTVSAPSGAYIDADGNRTELNPQTARARIEALGPSGMLRLPLAFPNRGGAAVGITKSVVAGARTLNGLPATRIDATPAPKPYREASLYLDPVSQRLLAARFLTDAGELLLTFGDYRTVAPNLVVPFQRVVYRDGNVVSSVEIDAFSLDADLEDALFTGSP